MSSATLTLLGGVGGLTINGYDLRDSLKKRTELQKNAQKVDQAVIKLGPIAPELQAEIAPSAEKSVEAAEVRVKSAIANIASDVCGGGSAIVNIVTSSLVLAGNTSSVLGGLQRIGTKFGYVTSGVADVYNGCMQSVACVKAVKNWWTAKDPQSAKIYGWHAVNQGVNTVATWSKSAASFVSVPGLTVSLGVGTVAPAIIFAVGAGVVTVASDYICKGRMKAAQVQNPSNTKAILSRLEIQPSQSLDVFADFLAEKRKLRQHILVPTTPSSSPSKKEGVIEFSLSPRDYSGISPVREDDESQFADDGYALPGGVEDDPKYDPEI